jgi:hypothetical protein
VRPLHPDNPEAEAEIAAAAAAWSGADYFRIGFPRSRVDGLFVRDGAAVALAEIKDRSIPFGFGDCYKISERKVRACRELHALTGLPVFLIARFACGKIAYLNFERDYTASWWGREDRGDPHDKGPCAGFMWSDFKLVTP